MTFREFIKSNSFEDGDTIFEVELSMLREWQSEGTQLSLFSDTTRSFDSIEEAIDYYNQTTRKDFLNKLKCTNHKPVYDPNKGFLIKAEELGKYIEELEAAKRRIEFLERRLERIFHEAKT